MYTTRQLTLILAGLATLWILAVGTGDLGTDDTNHRLTMAHAWLTHTPEVPADLPAPLSRKDTQHGIVGRDGRRVIFYDPGQSLLMMPADWIGTRLGTALAAPDKKGVRIWMVNWLVFQPLNIALVLVSFWTMRLLNFEWRPAALSSLFWLIATTVLPYAQIDWQNNQVLLFSLLSMALVLKSRESGSRLLLAASGAAAGMAVLVRASAAIHLLTAGLFLLMTLRQERVPVRDAFWRAAWWTGGAAPLVLAGRLFDYLRYGSPWVTGQSMWLAHVNSDPLYAGLATLPPGFPFNHPASEGILGVLVSPAKSLFLYDPLLLPCLLVAAYAWKRLDRYVRAVAVVALINLTLHLLLTSRLDFWHGDMAWGARYHVSSVHLLLVALLPVFVQRSLKATRGWSVAAWSVIVVSTLVQILAVSMPAGVEIAAEDFQEPVICLPDEWNSRLEFRLGARVRDLYCHATGTEAASCPEQIARAAERAHPAECRDMIEQFRKVDRLAFFPFNTAHEILGYRKELLLWCLLAGGALVGALAWCIQLVRDVWRRPAGESQALG